MGLKDPARQTYRQTDRQTDGQTVRQAGRQRFDIDSQPAGLHRCVKECHLTKQPNPGNLSKPPDLYSDVLRHEFEEGAGYGVGPC